MKKSNRREFLKSAGVVAAGVSVAQVIPQLSANENGDVAETDREATLRLPKSDVHYRETSTYIEEVPDNDYVHASEAAYEQFRDIKYSIRIIWGVYTLQKVEASWPMLNYSNEKKQEYQQLYKQFNPIDFDAEQWMTDFKRWGMQAFAFICKHHDGFALWHTKTKVVSRADFLKAHAGMNDDMIEPCDLHYSIEETPFKRDIVKELCDAGHKHDIKIDLYFSHPDWYDADFRPYNYHPLAVPDIIEHPKNYYSVHGIDSRKKILTPNRSPEETERMVRRHREQIHELLTNYGNVDMMCFDQWMGKDNWKDMKETIKLARKWSPNTMFRARGIGNYGDYYQPEQFVPKNNEQNGMPWMSICLLAKQFSYDPNSQNYKGARWVIYNLIDCVAKGGSFMVCLGPDEKGNFHPAAVKQLKEVGDWLKVNGKGIYATRLRNIWQADNIKFTRSKDQKNVYAFVEKFPEGELIVKSVTPKSGSVVRLFGYEQPLSWASIDGGIKITIPQELQDPTKRPCEFAWGFEFETGD
ncbi:MAG: alpha-L-fucosidase [Planctomycetaceae bacterium]|jgi:alpha-L-fucosidase|nr:alpha-L-fucosidase [Planctomycetaceae bacterium]